MSKERPEALAQFAESARQGERAGVQGLTATEATTPIPTDPKAKDEAATKILAEGATGQNKGAEEAIDQLPDRILESQDKDNTPSSDVAKSDADPPYDATRDPRTGRPPNPLERERLAREAELEKLRLGSDINSQAEDSEDDEPLEHDESESITEVIDADSNEHSRVMTLPTVTEDMRHAVEDLVREGVSRERAEDLVKTQGSDSETLIAAVWAAGDAKG